MKTILMTGAAGRIGSLLRTELAGKYRMRLSDLQPVRNLRAGETFMRADIANLDDALRITKGVDAVVHFGGQSGENTWERILSANIIGFYNTLEAARRNGVKRFLVATSNHAVGFYRCDQTIDHRVYIKPDSRYGVSKVFNEALASLYADRYGMQMFCMRIGNVNHAPIDRRRLAIWISPRDMAQLVTIGVEQPDLHFEIVYGVSDNARSWYDNSNALRLGYRSQDRSEDYAEEILKNDPPAGIAPADIYQGGGHCFSEGGTHSRLAPAPKVERANTKAATKKTSAKKTSAKKASAKKTGPKKTASKTSARTRRASIAR